MSNSSLEKAYSLLELLDYSLSHAQSSVESPLPLSGIRELIGQVKEIVRSNCPQSTSDAHNQDSLRQDSLRQDSLRQDSLRNGHDSKNFNEAVEEFGEKNKGVSSDSSIAYPSQNLDFDKFDFNNRDESEDAGIERIAYMNIPRVKTVPPEIRGKIRELVGIEVEEGL